MTGSVGNLGTGNSGASTVGPVNVAGSGQAAAPTTTKAAASSPGASANLVTQLTSGSPVHIPGTPDSVPLNVAAGLLLIGGVALGPIRRRPARTTVAAVVPWRPSGAHFARSK